MKVGICGLGKLGLPIAVCLGQKHSVLAYDVNPELNKYRQYGHRELGPTKQDDFQEHFDNADILFAPDVRHVVQNSDIVFIAVQTPHGPEYEGVTRLPATRADFNYKPLISAVREIAQYTRPDQPVVVISTVLPGTMRREIIPILKGGPYHPDRGQLVCNPFFIAMGQVMYDFLNPEFVLLGSDPESGSMASAGEKVKGFYKDFYGECHTPEYTRLCPPIRLMSIESAELTKVAYNTMLSMKVTIANSLMEICHRTPGCNIDDVTNTLKLATDRIISPKYMDGGMGDGGGCFTADCLVMTGCGPRRIADVSPGDRVLTVGGVYAPVVKRWERDYQGDVVEVRVEGMPSVIATPEHPFYASSDGRSVVLDGRRNTLHKIASKLGPLEVVEASHLQAGHFVAWPSVREDVERPSYAVDDYCLLAGWYLSEGMVDVRKAGTGAVRSGRISFALHKKEWKVGKSLCHFMESLSPPKMEGRGCGAVASVKERRENSLQVRYGSTSLAIRLLEDFGKGAASKRIPSWVLCGSRQTMALVLWGMFQGDGHATGKGYALSTISPNIAFGAYSMLERLGIGSTIQITPARIGKDGQAHRMSFEVRVRNHVDAKQLSRIIGMPMTSMDQDKKYVRNPVVDGNRMRRVRSVKRMSYNGKVYNLWVDHPSHTYVTSAGLVGNCHPRDNIAMSWLANKLDLSSDLFGALMHAREKQTEWLVDLITDTQQLYNYVGHPLVLLGKAYKPETNLTVGSPAILLANMLRERGVSFIHYDPYVDLPSKGEVDGMDYISKSFLDKGLTERALYFISTKHTSFANIKFSNGSVVIDPFRYIPPQEGVTIIPVGVGK